MLLMLLRDQGHLVNLYVVPLDIAALLRAVGLYGLWLVFIGIRAFTRSERTTEVISPTRDGGCHYQLTATVPNGTVVLDALRQHHHSRLQQLDRSLDGMQGNKYTHTPPIIPSCLLTNSNDSMSRHRLDFCPG